MRIVLDPELQMLPQRCRPRAIEMISAAALGEGLHWINKMFGKLNNIMTVVVIMVVVVVDSSNGAVVVVIVVESGHGCEWW